MTGFWSAYVTLITLISIAGVTWLLIANRTREIHGDDSETTGHVSDGIEEYDNPLPAWWFLMFVLSIVFAVGYLIVFPGLGAFEGLLGWTQIKQWQAQEDAADARYGPVFARYYGTPVAELINDSDALKMGQRIFANECAQCHGSDGRGTYGFPDLSDADWLWGGSIAQIQATISKGRQGAMPPWGAALGDQGVHDVAVYVQSLGGATQDGSVSAGAAQYQTFCASCHGADGSGNQMLGAPNLMDDIWLYGGDLEQIKHSIRNGRSNVMPAQQTVLGDEKIHLLTAFVYSLSAQ